MGCVVGDSATRADVVFVVTLHERPPGGGRALPGGATGQEFRLTPECIDH